MNKKQTLGVILAGGASSRMGREKALVAFKGKPLIVHVFERIRPQVDNIIINGPSDFGLGVPFVLDLEKDRKGPIAGIYATGMWAEQNFPEMTNLITVPVDGPFLPLDLVGRLLGPTPSIAETPKQKHPTFANWGQSPHHLIQKFKIRSEKQSLLALAEFAGAKEILCQDEGAFANINSPADLTQF